MLSVPRNDVKVFELPTRVSGYQTDTERLTRQLLQAAQGSSRLVLDFGRAQVVSAALLGVLISVTKRSQARRGDIVLCRLSPFARDVLRAAHLEEYWPTYEDLGTAIDGAPTVEPVIREAELLVG